MLLGNLDNRSNAGLFCLHLNNGLGNVNWNFSGRAFDRIAFLNKVLYRQLIMFFGETMIHSKIELIQYLFFIFLKNIKTGLMKIDSLRGIVATSNLPILYHSFEKGLDENLL